MRTTWMCLLVMACDPSKGEPVDTSTPTVDRADGAETGECDPPTGEVTECDGGATVQGVVTPTECGGVTVQVDLLDPLTGEVVVSDGPSEDGAYHILYGCGSYILRAGDGTCTCDDGAVWIDVPPSGDLEIDLEACCAP